MTLEDESIYDVTYPIAEKFVSPQGEGKNTGTLMQFIRFAGCSVGKPFTQDERDAQKLPIYQERCTIYDGRTFACDTDYRVKSRESVRQLVDWALSNDVQTVLFTGGEPLIHYLAPLMRALKKENFAIHLETSGTIKPDLNKYWWRLFDWICVSPKKHFQWEYADLNVANEFKLLVDENFDWEKVPDVIKRRPHKISVSPLNDEKTVNWDNVQRCVKLQQEHKGIRLTMQMHKLWGVR